MTRECRSPKKINRPLFSFSVLFDLFYLVESNPSSTGRSLFCRSALLLVTRLGHLSFRRSVFFAFNRSEGESSSLRGIGPWYIGSLTAKHFGAVFLWGTIVRGVYLPPDMQLFMGTIQVRSILVDLSIVV